MTTNTAGGFHETIKQDQPHTPIGAVDLVLLSGSEATVFRDVENPVGFYCSVAPEIS